MILLIGPPQNVVSALGRPSFGLACGGLILIYLSALFQIKDKAPRPAIIGKSNPRTKVEVEVDGLLYFTSK